MTIPSKLSFSHHGLRIMLMDSISYLDDHDAGTVVVSGSHGGVSSARYAMGQPLRGVVFNDAGGGKDAAGIAGLKLLDAVDMPAVAVSYQSARIGDAADSWASGIISAVNQAASKRGLQPGMPLQTALVLLGEPS